MKLWERRAVLPASTVRAQVEAAREAFKAWAEVHYRNVDEYGLHEYSIGLEAWLAALASAPVDIDAAANRLMGWPLPKDFCPDCGISFDGRKDDEWNKNKTWPVGTNLFSVEQAKKMLEYVLAGSSPAPAASAADPEASTGVMGVLERRGGKSTFHAWPDSDALPEGEYTLVSAQTAPVASAPVAWWNGIRKADLRDGTGPSFSEHEDTWHDIPVFSGVNPCNLPPAASSDALDAARWQPIATAPKDGTEILVWSEDGVQLVSWQGKTLAKNGKEGWCESGSWQDAQGGYTTVDNPSAWMPLPTGPSDAAGAIVASVALRANPTPPGSADALIKALSAAQSALLSFAHGNASEEFAKDMADNCAKAIDAFRAENKT